MNRDQEKQLQDNLALYEADLASLKSLEGNEGWKIIDTQLKANVQGVRQRINATAILSMDSAFTAATDHGILSGLTIAMVTHQTLIENLLADIEAVREELKSIEEDKTNG